MIRVCEQRETMIDKMKTECGFEFYERLDYTKLTDYYAYGNLIFGEPEFSEDGQKVTFRILKPSWEKSSWREKELTEKDFVRVSCDMDVVEMLRETEVGEHYAVNYARVLSCYREP